MLMLGFPPLWGWLGLGLVLIGAEILVAPGTYLLWIGLAALVMAGAGTMVSFSPGGELVAFGLLALAFGLVGWRIYGARTQDDAARDLHNPEVTLVGRTALLVTAIEGGAGQLKLDDVFWRATGPDLPAGTRVRVRAVDGSTLIVDAA